MDEINTYRALNDAIGIVILERLKFKPTHFLSGKTNYANFP